MPLVPFGEWTPDHPPLNGGSPGIVNAVPGAGGYDPMPWPSPVGPYGLPDEPMALRVATGPAGTVIPLAFCRANVYRAARTAWQPINPGPLPNATVWNAAQWGTDLYVVNGVSALMRFNVVTLRFETLPTPEGLGGAYLDVVGDFLVIGSTVALGGVGNPFRLRWSGNRRPADFAASTATQADGNDMADIGEIRGLTGGEFGLVLGSVGLARMDYVGPPDTWKFSTLETDVGCDLPKSVVRVGRRTFWHSRRGWRMSTGEASEPIGSGKVDRWFQRRQDPDRTDRMTAVTLDDRPLVLWSYVSRSSPDGRPDEVLAYDWEQRRWTMGRMVADVLGTSIAASPYTDDPDLPLIFGRPLSDDATDLYPNVSTDSYGDAGSFPAAIVGGALHRLAAFGTSAELELNELELTPGRLTTLQRLRPVAHDAGNVAVDVWGRDRADVADWRQRNGLIAESSGRVSVRMKARYHRVKLRVDPPFRTVVGVDVEQATPAGRR